MGAVGARYFVDVVGWTMLSPTQVLIYSWSERLDDLHPPEDEDEELMRGHVHYGGIILEAKGASGCQATYIAKVNLNMYNIMK
jgi:hypothetical protein